MLRTMVKEFSKAGYDLIIPLNKKLKRLTEWLDADVLLAKDGINEALSHRPDAALIIAPENGGELEQITARIGKKDVTVLGAQEKVIRASADKWLTYSALKYKVPQPRTWKKPPKANSRILAKSMDGVRCEGTEFYLSRRRGEEKIYQEFIEGENASCCLLMSEGQGQVLSVNKQDIITDGRFKYTGGEIPFKHRLTKKCVDVALNAAKILDLRGYCGVDLVLGDIPYFVELNPRVTTSFVPLSQILQANLAEILMDVIIENKPLPKPKLRGHSIIKIPRAKRNLKVAAKKLNQLKEIPGIIAPPFAPEGIIKKGYPIFLVSRLGNNQASAKRHLIETIEESLSLLGVEKNEITWH